MTMKQMAAKIEIPYGSYGVIESGHMLPSQDILDRICIVLKCRPADVYDSDIVRRIEAYDKAVKIISAVGRMQQSAAP